MVVRWCSTAAVHCSACSLHHDAYYSNARRVTMVCLRRQTHHVEVPCGHLHLGTLKGRAEIRCCWMPCAWLRYVYKEPSVQIVQCVEMKSSGSGCRPALRVDEGKQKRVTPLETGRMPTAGAISKVCCIFECSWLDAVLCSSLWLSWCFGY